MSEKERGALRTAENPDLNPGEQDYRDKFDSITNQPDMQALNDQGDAIARDSVDKSRSQVASAEKEKGKPEKHALADTEAGKAALAAASTAGGPAGKIAAKLLGRIKTKQGGVGVVVGALLLLIMSVGMFTTVLAPVAFIENVIDDLNDQLAALDIRQTKIMRAKVSYSEKNEAFKGCSKLSIRCKAKSLSKRQIKYFKENGIEVQGDTKFGRTFPKSYTFKGGDPMGPAAFVNRMQTDPVLRLSFKRAVNMKYLGFADTRFIRWTQAKLGISKKKPVLTGTEAERTKELATQKKTTVTADSKFIDAVDKEGNQLYDSDGKPLYYLEGDPTGKTYTQADIDSFKARWESFSKSKFGTQTLKAISLVGWYDMACSVKNMIGMTATTARVLNQFALAEYSSNIWSLAHSQKASDITPEDSVALNNFFLRTDEREYIPDPEQSILDNVVDGMTQVPDMEESMIENPNYGKNVMDSALYQMSATGSPAIVTEGSARYSLGFGQSTLLSIVNATATTIDKFVNLGSDSDACDFIQNWAVRTISTVVGVIAAFFSGGSTVAFNVALMVAVGVAFFAVSSVLMAALTNSIIPDDIDEKPDEKAAALWTGKAAILGTSAQARGMYPGSADEIVGYQKLVKSSVKDYVAIESEKVSPFDLTSPYSAAGKLALSLNRFRPTSLDASSVLASVGKLNSTAVSSIVPTATAYDPKQRYQMCDDESYTAIKIDADVQCNVRYVMSTEDLERDAEEAIEYMEKNGYVEVDPEVGQTITGLPEGYTPPNPQESSGFIQGVVSGVVNGFYSTRSFGSTENAQMYGKFLDYCVYRAMPYSKYTFEENGAWGSAEPEWKTGENCKKQGLPYSAFRTFTMDTTIHDITEEVDEEAYGSTTGTATGSTGGTGGTGTVSGDAKSLAQQLLDLEKAGKIRFAVLRSEDIGTRTTPELQLVDIAAGKNPAIVTRCSFTVPGPIVPDPKLLQFLVNLGQQYNYMITSLYGQCHSSTSLHYKGKAVDFNCPLNTTLADKIGAPLGVKRNWETCANDFHWHYGVY